MAGAIEGGEAGLDRRLKLLRPAGDSACRMDLGDEHGVPGAAEGLVDPLEVCPAEASDADAVVAEQAVVEDDGEGRHG